MISNVDVPAAAFFHGNSDAVAIDRSSQSILHIRDVWNSGTIWTLAGQQESVSESAVLAVASDNRRVIVADGPSCRVTALALDGGTPAVLQCHFRPTRLDRLRGNAVFRLTDAVDGLIWLFDGDASESRFVFIPAGTTDSDAQKGDPR